MQSIPVDFHVLGDESHSNIYCYGQHLLSLELYLLTSIHNSRNIAKWDIEDKEWWKIIVIPHRSGT